MVAAAGVITGITADCATRWAEIGALTLGWTDTDGASATATRSPVGPVDDDRVAEAETVSNDCAEDGAGLL